MTFFSLIFKNIFRHKARTILTVLGISIGITTIIVFGLVSSGYEEMIGDVIKPGMSDFTVARSGAADFILSFLSQKQVEKIKNAEGVEKAAAYVLSVASYEENPFFVVTGLEPDKLDLAGAKIIDGRPYAKEKEIIVGKIAAKNKNLKTGDNLILKQEKFQITGIFESGVPFQDSGAMTFIHHAQKIQGVSDQVNTVIVKVKKGYDVKEVAKSIEMEDPELVSIIELEDFDAIDQGRKSMAAVSLVISLLAIFIGGLGAANTIIMSVFERTREIGVLRAVGWHRLRIARMILGESILMGIFSAAFAIFFSLLIVFLIEKTEIGQSWIVIKYEPIIFVRAILVSLAVVLTGAIYPSFKASRLLPTEALRHE